MEKEDTMDNLSCTGVEGSLHGGVRGSNPLSPLLLFLCAQAWAAGEVTQSNVRRCKVIVVTERAAEELKETLREHATDDEQALRLTPAPGDVFVLTLDVEQEGDEVVESEGTKLLLMDASVAPALDGIILDCVDTPEGPRLTLSKE
jgi:Fe-S cluster assembly iron-binding protein IscA